MLVLRSHQLIMDKKVTPSCHASTVLPREDGSLVAWFGGSHEGSPDVGIWMAVKDEKGFGEPVLVAQGMKPHWNPVLFAPRGGHARLFYKVGTKIPNWRTMVIDSVGAYGNGKVYFSNPRQLVPGDTSGGRGPVRNHCLEMKSGRILAPASCERGLWRCFMDISDDHGQTWRKSNILSVPGLEDYDEKLAAWQALAEKSETPIDRPEEIRHGRGIIQPALWEDESGVHALMRSGEGFIYRSDSSDGEVWCEPYPTKLPNNNSGIDLARMPDGTLLLVCNPVQESWGARTPISILESKDGGENWERLCDLETGPGEFSYPSIAVLWDRVHITYTYNRENIAYWEFDWN